jgi:hypothetical protein
MTITTPKSIGNKTTKVKRLKEDGFCVFLFLFCLGFVLWRVFFFMFSSSLKSFYHQKSSHYLQIKHNREFFITKREKLCHKFGFS